MRRIGKKHGLYKSIYTAWHAKGHVNPRNNPMHDEPEDGKQEDDCFSHYFHYFHYYEVWWFRDN